MKTKIALSLMLLWFAGCQQKSEVDKCVEAIVKADTDSKSSAQYVADTEAEARIDCLKAQSGK
jgi:hypothetical protein